MEAASAPAYAPWQDALGSDTSHAECVSAHWREKYERDAGRSWDRFYGRHATNFFKDRHYLREAFPELAVASPSTLLDCGCGVGNALLPLLESSPELRVIACDISSTAIALLKADATFAALAAAGRCEAFVRDATADELPPPVQAQPADCALMLFVLSAIAPDKMLAAVRFAAAGLRPGGTFLFRDYGRYDHAQIRFGEGAKLRDHFYVRQDGTRAYFFSLEEMVRLTCAAGLEPFDVHYIKRTQTNAKSGQVWERTWVHLRARKPLE